jgi:mannose-6-phosphate isomerase-like protein (cupin superfamily)
MCEYDAIIRKTTLGGIIMKLPLLVTTLLISAALLAATDNPTVTYVDHEKAAKGGTLATAPDLSVSINRRTGAGQVEVHEKETDTFYVLDGEATIVTGGTMVGGKVSRPGQQLGTGINGGETRHLVKGDVMVIPAGVPHWFKEVPKEINYYVVKVIKP